MKPLSYLELKGIRGTVEGVMSTYAEIWRRVSTSDNSGGTTDTYVLRSSTNCMFYPNLGNSQGSNIEQARPDVIAMSANYTFIFPYNTEIKYTDQIHALGNIYEIKAISFETDELTFLVTVGANEIVSEPSVSV